MALALSFQWNYPRRRRQEFAGIFIPTTYQKNETTKYHSNKKTEITNFTGLHDPRTALEIQSFPRMKRFMHV